MDIYNWKNGELFVEKVPFSRIAHHYGTPTYVYSRTAIEAAWNNYESALKNHPHLICYAVKANSNIAILNCLARLGSGFDIVSAGELERVLHAGGDKNKIVFSGVGKTTEELQHALEVGIKCFNVESVAELDRLHSIAKKMKKKAPISIRVNPDVDAQTHPHIATGLKENKFGIAVDYAVEVYEIAKDLKYVDVQGIACHIGSQVTQLQPFREAIEQITLLVEKLRKRKIALSHIDLGGGLGVAYGSEKEVVPDIASYIGSIRAALVAGQCDDCELILEPGRSVVAAAGVLLTRVEYIKHTEINNFAIVDAAMNDLMRPSLYNGWHNVHRVYEQSTAESQYYDLVGAICESGDFLAKNRKLAITQGDLLAIDHVGAYGFSMSNNYNSRPRCVEVMVTGEKTFEIRRRETIQELFDSETILPPD